MKLFDSLPEFPTPKTGLGRYLEAAWENIGKLLMVNFLCFLGFLPLAMGISLGVILENFWLACLGGLLGGAIACPVWVASLRVAILCFQNAQGGWFALWKQTIKNTLPFALREGAAFGTLAGCLMGIGGFLSEMVAASSLPSPVVLLGLGLDGFVLVMAFQLLVCPLAFAPDTFRARLVRVDLRPKNLLAGVLLSVWCAVGILLFPVSVPFAAVVGFWPILLLLAQLGQEQWEPYAPAPAEETPCAPKKRRLGVILTLLVVLTAVLGFLQVFLNYQEPDLQVAIVHATALPDEVLHELEQSFGTLIGDRNGDGAVCVQVNDYVVSFRGDAPDMSVQTASFTRLVTDVSAGDSSIFLVEDTEGFLANYADLFAPQNIWSTYPALSSLNVGSYLSLEDNQIHNGQECLAGLTILLHANCPEKIANLLLQ